MSRNAEGARFSSDPAFVCKQLRAFQIGLGLASQVASVGAAPCLLTLACVSAQFPECMPVCLYYGGSTLGLISIFRILAEDISTVYSTQNFIARLQTLQRLSQGSKANTNPRRGPNGNPKLYNPCKPSTPSKPLNPKKPSQPSKPYKPYEPSKPYKPYEPSKPSTTK